MSTAIEPQKFDSNGLPLNGAPKPKKLSNAEYHQHGAISNSRLKLFAESRKLYRAIYVDKTLEYNVTPAMLLGSLVHCMLLEPEEVHSQYVVCPECDRRTKEGKAIWADFCATAGTREVIKMEMWEQAQAICKAVLANEMVQSIFDACDLYEHAHFWIDYKTGHPCRCKFDMLSRERDMVFDFKITGEAGPKAFASQIASFCYDGQAAWYSDGYLSLEGRVPNFVFVAVQKEPPFEIGFYELHADDIANAKKRNEKLLAQLIECHGSGNWEMPHEREIQTIRLPRFAAYRDEYTN